MWRPQLHPELNSVPFDLRSYHVDDEYSFSAIDMPISYEEMQILKGADQVFVTSKGLQDKKGWVNVNTSFVPNGVDYEAFALPMTEPQDLAVLPHPRIGYAGFLKDQLDWTLLAHLSARHPEWHFVFLGPVSPHYATVGKIAELRKRSNVHFLEGKPTALVPGYVQHFDVCIMPYLQNDYTKYIYPLKLHEYLASGCPTVGTPIRSLEEFSDVVELPRSADEWSAALAHALSPAANTPELRAARRAVAKGYDWDLQVRRIAMILAYRVAPELLTVENRDRARPSSDAPLDLRTMLPGFSSAPADPLESNEIRHANAALESVPAIGPVLLVTPWYRPAVGGVAEVAERLHRAFVQAGVKTHLLVANEELGDLHADPGVPNLWRWAVPSSVFDRLHLKSLLSTFIKAPLAYWKLSRFVRSQKIRTIVLIYPTGYAWPFLPLRRLTDVRIISSIHGNDVTKFNTYQAPLRWLIRHVLESSDAIITCASHLGTKAQEISFNRTLNVDLIPNCVDSTCFVPPPPNYIRSDSRPTFIHVSNFAPKKRTLDIIDAFCEPCIPSDARLIMVGDGRDYVEATQRAVSTWISHRIEFVGAQRDIRPFLWEADVFVLASDDEGAPLALLEAMACGLPYVSTPWGPAAMLPAGECGFVVPPRSPRLLAAAMTELIKDPERRLAMGRRARYRAETDFLEETYVERHLQLIRSIEMRTTKSHHAQNNLRAKIGFQGSHDMPVNRPDPFTHEGGEGHQNDGR